MTSPDLHRRRFLRNSLGLATGSLLTTFDALQRVQASASLTPSATPSLTTTLDNSPGDYKALVCLFLRGGNDGFNTIIPTDDIGYQEYSSARGSLTLEQSQLLRLNAVDVGFHPACTGFRDLFNNGNLAILANTGTLIEPVSLADYHDKRVALPPQLFSHADQRKLWVTGDAKGDVATGWAGRMADLVNTAGAAGVPATNINFDRNNTFQAGEQTQPYSLDRKGVRELQTLTAQRGKRSHADYLQAIALGQQHAHPLVREYARLQSHSLESTAQIKTTLEAATEFSDLFTEFPRSQLAAELNLTAQLIEAQASLGNRRQIFFIEVGSWDTHDNQLASQANLLEILSTNLREFYLVLEAMGMSNNVTSFTSSEFGRTLSSNGDGSDHGWGSHSLVMGGAVDGGKVFGTLPELVVGGNDDAGHGRIIPTTAVDQTIATLARWFGLGETELNELLPNLQNFNSTEPGFMQAANTAQG